MQLMPLSDVVPLQIDVAGALGNQSWVAVATG